MGNRLFWETGILGEISYRVFWGENRVFRGAKPGISGINFGYFGSQNISGILVVKTGILVSKTGIPGMIKILISGILGPRKIGYFRSKITGI